MLEDAAVLITGGGGSVGRALISRLLDKGSGVVRVFANNEPSLSKPAADFDDVRLRYLAGDIRDESRLDRAMEGVDVIVHTAAMKHVISASTTLRGGTDERSRATERRRRRNRRERRPARVHLQRQAVNLANTMGTTKLLGEKLVTAGNKHAGDRDIKLASVRFGNVINSSQSVISLFKEQIREGGPVTLTD